MCKNTHMLLFFLQDTIQAFRHTRNTWPDFLLLPHHLVLLHWELQVWKALPEHILVRAALCVVRDSPNSLQKFLQRSPLINTHFPQSLMVCSEQTPRCWTALLCFGVIYTHGGAQSSTCCCLTSAGSRIPREGLEAELYLPLCPHVPTMANSSSSSLQGPGSSLQGPEATTVPLQPLKLSLLKIPKSLHSSRSLLLIPSAVNQSDPNHRWASPIFQIHMKCP